MWNFIRGPHLNSEKVDRTIARPRQEGLIMHERKAENGREKPNRVMATTP